MENLFSYEKIQIKEAQERDVVKYFFAFKF
jgi:hypothetical protein